MRIAHRLVLAASLGLALAGCNRFHPELAVDPSSTIAMTGGPNSSLVYLARTDSGIIAIDLGWWGHEHAIKRGLDRLGAKPADVKRVFLTHSHRDHIGAWSMVRQARFHLSAAEYRLLTGQSSHHGWIVRTAEWFKDSKLPKPGELDAQTFSRDTVYVLGRDTLRAYIVPGHTAGSAVYLFRGVLFAGDAVMHTPLRGFKSAKGGFSDDKKLAAENLEKLWPRLPGGGVRYLCTAHAECTEFSRYPGSRRIGHSSR